MGNLNDMGKFSIVINKLLSYVNLAIKKKSI